MGFGFRVASCGLRLFLAPYTLHRSPAPSVKVGLFLPLVLGCPTRASQLLVVRYLAGMTLDIRNQPWNRR